jgi:hypothetical protein
MKNNLKLLFLSLFVLLGCEKVVELKIDENDSKIVLNAWLKTDQYPQVEINRSTFIFDKRGSSKIEDAEVILFENNEELGFLEHFEGGFYKNENITIKPNAEYKIIANVDGFKDVTATEKLTEKLPESDYEFEYTIVSSPYGYDYQPESQVKITIKDQASTEDYYLFSVTERRKNWSSERPGDTTYHESQVYVDSNDSQTEPIYLQRVGQIQLLKDELFDGNDYSIRFTTNDLRKHTYSADGNTTSYRYDFEIHKISKSFYLYLKSLEYNQYPDPFTEPTQVFTNIENGYGILATSAVVRIPIEESRDEDMNE